MGRRNSSSAARMQTIEGMRKLPEPKMRRQTSGGFYLTNLGEGVIRFHSLNLIDNKVKH